MHFSVNVQISHSFRFLYPIWTQLNHPVLWPKRKVTLWALTCILSEMILVIPWQSPWPHPMCYLNPWPSVVFCSCPRIYQPLLIETCIVGIPLLESKKSSVGRGSCDLLIWYDSAFNSQWARTFWEQIRKRCECIRKNSFSKCGC